MRFFPCLLEGASLNKTVSVEITQNENSLSKTATIEFINHTPPSVVHLTYAGETLFRGVLKKVDTRRCGVYQAFYETEINCSDLGKTSIITKEAFNFALYNSFIKTFREYSPPSPIEDPPAYFIRRLYDGSSVTVYASYHDVVGLAGNIAASYNPPHWWRTVSSIVNLVEFLQYVVRLRASEYPPTTLLGVRVIHLYYFDNLTNRWTTDGTVEHFYVFLEDASSFTVYIDNRLDAYGPIFRRPIRTISDVFGIFGHVIRTNSTAKIFKPLIFYSMPADLLSLLQKAYQNFSLRVDENGRIIGTDVDLIQNRFSLPASAIFDYSLPSTRKLSITMETEKDDYKNTLRISDLGCTINSIQLNNDTFFYEPENFPSLFKHFKINHQDKGRIRAVLLPSVELYHLIDIPIYPYLFRVVGYTHRINSKEAATDLTVVEEVM